MSCLTYVLGAKVIPGIAYLIVLSWCLAYGWHQYNVSKPNGDDEGKAQKCTANVATKSIGLWSFSGFPVPSKAATFS